MVEEVNVRLHRAGRKGFDTGLKDVPTSEQVIVPQTCYVTSIYIQNQGASAPVTVKDNRSPTPKVFFSKSLEAGEYVSIVVVEPLRFEGGIRIVAGGSGVVYQIVGYL
jgi:hypothetical protein